MKTKSILLVLITIFCTFTFTNSHAGGNAALIVKINGVVGDEDPCPKPRFRRSYSTIQAAVNCARNGDTIQVMRGVFVGVTSGSATTIDKNLKIIGRGPSNSLITRNFDIGNVKVLFRGFTFSDNSGAGDGGIMETTGKARVEVDDCVFVENLASDGGAIKINSGARFTIKNSIFSVNGGGNTGGAITNEGTLRLANSVVAGNNAATGAGIYNTGKLTIYSSLITRNNALSAGGGIFNDGGKVNIDSRTILTLNTPEDCVGCP